MTIIAVTFIIGFLGGAAAMWGLLTLSGGGDQNSVSEYWLRTRVYESGKEGY